MALKLAQDENRGNELELRKDKRGLKVELKEQQLAHEDVIKNMKKVGLCCVYGLQLKADLTDNAIVCNDYMLILCRFICWKRPRVGPGHPSPPLVHLLPHFPPFTFPFLSLALSIFFFCPSLLFLPE